MKRERFLVQTLLNEEDYQTLKMLADMAGVSISDAVRMCIRYVINEAIYVIRRSWEMAVEQKLRSEVKGDVNEADSGAGN